MKAIPGKIIIKDKVYFEPDGLEKPKLENHAHLGNWMRYFRIFQKKMKAYEASKQLIEVENVLSHLMPRLNEQKVIIYYDILFANNDFEQIKNNQNCKAEIKGECDIIISLTKE